MKTTIIDILNKIANNEQPPKRIVFDEEVYEYEVEDKDYRNKNYEGLFDYYDIGEILNKEVEILETTITLNDKFNYLQKLAEEEIPDKIEKFSEEEMSIYHDMPAPIDDMAHKINEIIEAINER